MSALLREGIDDIDRRRLPLSLLKGMRHRYRRFGFEDGGRRLGLVLHRRRFPDPGWSDEQVVHVAGLGASTQLVPGFCERLLAVQKRYLGRALRSLSAQRAMISRRGVHTYYVERAGDAAYALAGDWEGLIWMMDFSRRRKAERGANCMRWQGIPGWRCSFSAF